MGKRVCHPQRTEDSGIADILIAGLPPDDPDALGLHLLKPVQDACLEQPDHRLGGRPEQGGHQAPDTGIGAGPADQPDQRTGSAAGQVGGLHTIGGQCRQDPPSVQQQGYPRRSAETAQRREHAPMGPGLLPQNPFPAVPVKEDGELLPRDRCKDDPRVLPALLVRPAPVGETERGFGGRSMVVDLRFLLPRLLIPHGFHHSQQADCAAPPGAAPVLPGGQIQEQAAQEQACRDPHRHCKSLRFCAPNVFGCHNHYTGRRFDVRCRDRQLFVRFL